MAKNSMGMPKEKGVTGVKTKADDKSPRIKTKNGPNGQQTSSSFTPKMNVATEMLLPAPRTPKAHPLPKKYTADVAPKSNPGPNTRMKGSF